MEPINLIGVFLVIAAFTISVSHVKQEDEYPYDFIRIPLSAPRVLWALALALGVTLIFV